MFGYLIFAEIYYVCYFSRHTVCVAVAAPTLTMDVTNVLRIQNVFLSFKIQMSFFLYFREKTRKSPQNHFDTAIVFIKLVSVQPRELVLQL